MSREFLHPNVCSVPNGFDARRTGNTQVTLRMKMNEVPNPLRFESCDQISVLITVIGKGHTKTLVFPTLRDLDNHVVDLSGLAEVRHSDVSLWVRGHKEIETVWQFQHRPKTARLRQIGGIFTVSEDRTLRFRQVRLEWQPDKLVAKVSPLLNQELDKNDVNAQAALIDAMATDLYFQNATGKAAETMQAQIQRLNLTPHRETESCSEWSIRLQNALLKE